MAVNEKHKKPRRQRIPAYVVEIEYGAKEDAADMPPRAHESVSNMAEVRGIPTDAERCEKVVKILAEAVYGYLKRRGQLAARARQTAGNTPEAGPGSEGRILDECLDFQAQPTGTCDCLENS